MPTPRPHALVELVPFYNPEWTEEEQPDFAPTSMMGTCPAHGLERITREGVSRGSDPTHLFYFACGEIDPTSFGSVD